MNNNDYDIYTSYDVLNEIKFILLINEAKKLLNTEKRRELIEIIKKNKELRKSVIEKYLKFYINLSAHIKILINKDAEISSSNNIFEYGLLPTDATILALMNKHKINTILTNDSDFKKIKDIKVIES